MAGFDMSSVLNNIMGDKQQAQDGAAGRPQQPGAGGLGGLLSGDMLGKLAPMLSSMMAGGGLAKLMSRLQSGGLGSQAKSWVATDQANEPVTGEQMTQALGPVTISQVAAKLGVSDEQAAHTMAQTLPGVVDAMTPDGQVPDAESAEPPDGRDSRNTQTMGSAQNMGNSQSRMAAAGPASGNPGASPSSIPRMQPASRSEPGS